MHTQSLKILQIKGNFYFFLSMTFDMACKKYTFFAMVFLLLLWYMEIQRLGKRYSIYNYYR